MNPPAASTTGTHVPSVTQIVWNWNNVTNAAGYKWNTTNDYASAIDMGIAITKTETGLTCNSNYTRYAWAYSICGNSTPVTLTESTSLNPPAVPIPGNNLPSAAQVIWNWNEVIGAIGYKWNTINDYASAIDIGTSTTKTEIGLTCNTPYTRFVWAYNACGTSIPVILNQTTSLDPPASPLAGNHIPSPFQIVWNWNTVSNAIGYKWNIINDYGNATDIGTSTTMTETGLICDTVYTRYIWAYSTCGISSPTTVSQSTNAITCPSYITDSRDGHNYSTVLIGCQCWMSQNLNIGTEINTPAYQTNNGVIEKFCYNNSPEYCDDYGGLYQWAEMVQYLNGATNNTSWNPVPTGNVQGICPSGWHVPTDNEWCQMITFLDPDWNCAQINWQVTNAGGKLKSNATYPNCYPTIVCWYIPNTGATNSSGFNAKPVGIWTVGALFCNQKYYSQFRNATELSETQSMTHSMAYNSTNVDHSPTSKECGFAVRCVKD